MSAVLRSRFPQIIASLGPRMDAVARAGAEVIEQRAKTRVPIGTGKLRDAIHTEREGQGDYWVVAGDTEAWYGHLVEFGTSHTGARPFLVPAVEEAREEVESLAAAALRRL